MRTVITLIVFLLSYALLPAQDTWYVAAPSGLKLRETDGPNGTVITTIPYGTRLETDDIPGMPIHTAEGFQGAWLRVIYDGHKGYVFDGFLLPDMPPPQNGLDIAAYMQQLPVQASVSFSEGRKYIFYTNGIVYSLYRGDEYASETWRIPQLHTVQQAYLFCRLFAWDNGLLSAADILPEKSMKDAKREFTVVRPESHPYLLMHIRVEGELQSGEYAALDISIGEGEIVILFSHGH